MTIYISGPITGIPNDNKEAFAEAEKKLTDLGHKPLNPLKNDKKNELPIYDYDSNYYKLLKKDLISMLQDCAALFLLENWEKSYGANLEVYVAMQLKMPIYVIDNNELVEKLYLKN